MSAHMSAVSSYRISTEVTEGPTVHATIEPIPCACGADISSLGYGQCAGSAAWPGCPRAPAT
eukprot:9042105-Alexandrium_andersonii.AAC.1